MRNALILLACLAVAGCAGTMPAMRYPTEVAPPDSTANYSESPNSSAAKVAAVMAENDITLPQVASYLNAYGFDVTPRSAWIRAHWRRSEGADYHIFRPYIATADTAVEFQVRGNISGTWPADVVGADILPDGRVVYSPWSEIGWRGGGNGAGAVPGIAATGNDALLPGVAE